MCKLKVLYRALGVMPTNVFFLSNTETKEAIIVDPAANAEFIIRMMNNYGFTPAAILLTHGHFDHILAVNDLKEAWPEVKVYAYESERQLLATPNMNCSGRWLPQPYTTKADVWVKNHQKLNLAGFEIEVLHTPGHTGGSCCYYLEEEKVLMSGDTLFRESYGRTDLDTGSMMQMNHSINEVLMKLPDDVDVYPGHNDMTDIGHERDYNPLVM